MPCLLAIRWTMLMRSSWDRPRPPTRSASLDLVRPPSFQLLSLLSKLTCHRRADMQFPSTYPNTPPKVLMYELHPLLRSHLCAHSPCACAAFRYPAPRPTAGAPDSIRICTQEGKVSINANAAFTGEPWPHHLPPAVCLSILGTWSGESEDEWRSSYSINYVLSAIQSLIMTAKPYHNEPGYEEVPTRAGSCSLC